MKKIIKSISLGIMGAALLSLPVTAQTVGLGTTKGGATAQIANAIASVVSDAGVIQMRPAVSANTSQYIPLVNAGRLEFGIANYPQTFYAVQGTGMSSEPNPDLRVVATLFPFKPGILTPKSTGIKSYSDLKGYKVPRFPDKSLGDFVIRAALSAGGLGYEDIQEVPIANFPRMFDAVKQGQTDISIAATGSKPTYDIQAAVGDITFIPFAATDEAKVAKILPGATIVEIAANADLPGLGEGTSVIAYDYLLFAHKDVSDEAVTAVLTALAEGQEALKSTSPLWREYDPSGLGKTSDLEYHPAAVTFHKSQSGG